MSRSRNLPLGTIVGTTPAASRTTTANLGLTARTVALTTTVGLTENVDVAVVVPLVSVKVAGSSTVIDGNGTVTRVAQTTSLFSGIGDVSAMAKYRLFKFKGPDMPDPGGVALLVDMRLPTGSRENLRGLGVTRTLIGGVVSAGRGRLRPHATAGFDYWSKGVDVAGAPGQTVHIRHQFQYAGGVELEAAPKVTLLMDFLGQRSSAVARSASPPIQWRPAHLV